MRIWLIGADQDGVNVLRQMKKNPTAEVIVTDAQERPRAVADGVIARVDYVEAINSTNINQQARRIRPDLILIDAGAMQRALRRVSGGNAFTESLVGEMANASEFPCIVL